MAALAMAAVACGEPATIPELTATPLPEARAAATPLEAPAANPDTVVGGSVLAATEDDDTAVAAESPPETATDDPPPAPSHDAQRAAFLYAHTEDAPWADHLSDDLVGDGVPELVLATVAPDGGFAVTLATWGGGEYVRSDAVSAGTARKVGTPVARDLTGDGRREILAPFTADAGPAVLALAVADDGVLTVPSRCPVAEPATHHLRLRTSRAATVVVLSCDAGTVARDGVVLQWHDGLFVVPPVPVDADESRRGKHDRGRPSHAGPLENAQADDRGDDERDDERRRGRGPDLDRRGHGEGD